MGDRYNKYNTYSTDEISYFICTEKFDKEHILEYVNSKEYSYGIKLHDSKGISNIIIIDDVILIDGDIQGVKVHSYKNNNKEANVQWGSIIKELNNGGTFIKFAKKEKVEKLNVEKNKEIELYGTIKIEREDKLRFDVKKELYMGDIVYAVYNRTYDRFHGAIMTKAGAALLLDCLSEKPIRKVKEKFYSFKCDPCDDIRTAKLDVDKVRDSLKANAIVAVHMIGIDNLKGIHIYRYSGVREQFNTLIDILKSMGYSVVKSTENSIYHGSKVIHSCYNVNVCDANVFLNKLIFDYIRDSSGTSKLSSSIAYIMFGDTVNEIRLNTNELSATRNLMPDKFEEVVEEAWKLVQIYSKIIEEYAD